MVKLRLQRYGTKKRPFYRIVVANVRDRRDGRFVEIVGLYDPLSAKEPVRLEKEKIQTWIQKGAVPSDTVASLLKKNGVELKAQAGEKTHKGKKAGA
ncbi:MAG: 30S ribosomal protein S16 [Leptonema illini]|uniref:Small ribosomal subunit protein bS16 n=2 Tax=Leptonema illini TaxID=183 RepID=H2CH12_9LEPT|nr:30S ribosomal protein S16 [Leptonema illini]EHQ05854.1 30S ribosomal protein S16 [Leptonema illini DSM 21528]KAB2932432.1 MAG: 30S ribosomal protein S16 [Leptonema illini]PKL29792.1 MAG: 30S ribosomal protein S16 [Spirochaetae bacterium HGW-Spirochaetae-10]